MCNIVKLYNSGILDDHATYPKNCLAAWWWDRCPIPGLSLEKDWLNEQQSPVQIPCGTLVVPPESPVPCLLPTPSKYGYIQHQPYRSSSTNNFTTTPVFSLFLHFPKPFWQSLNHGRENNNPHNHRPRERDDCHKASLGRSPWRLRSMAMPSEPPEARAHGRRGERLVSSRLCQFWRSFCDGQLTE